MLFCEFQPFHFSYINIYKWPLFTFSFLKTILGKKTHNTPICVYGVFERLGIDLTEYTDTRAGKKEKHSIGDGRLFLNVGCFSCERCLFWKNDIKWVSFTSFPLALQIFVGQDY